MTQPILNEAGGQHLQLLQTLEDVRTQRARLEALALDMRSRLPSQRLGAAQELAHLPAEWSIPLLADALADKKSRVRLAAVNSLLGFHHPEAISLLCRCLNDPNEEVRYRAARGLGSIGDVTAIPALAEAVRGGLLGRKPWLHVALLTLIIVAGLAMAGYAVKVLIVVGPGVWCMLQWLIEPLHEWSKKREKQSRSQAEAVRALEKIADRAPAPALRGLLPELRMIARAGLNQSGEVRKASRRAAIRIEQLTRATRDLPIPASDTCATHDLPRTVEAEASPARGRPKAELQDAPRLRVGHWL